MSEENIWVISNDIELRTQEGLVAICDLRNQNIVIMDLEEAGKVVLTLKNIVHQIRKEQDI